MKDLVQKKLDQYLAKSEQEEENALKEIMQEVVLYALSKSGFFEVAAFHGGTCLRIIHGLDRFSEDLDFALHRPQPQFDLGAYLVSTGQMMKPYGFQIEVAGVDRAGRNVRQRFLKDDSIKKLIQLKHLSDVRKNIQIKIEVDINPPTGAVSEVRYGDFPTDFSMMTHDLGSLFAGKMHALLCRPYVKGRDWYDFSWYIAQKISLNYQLLTAALQQTGPWEGQGISADGEWVKKTLAQKIEATDWLKVVVDVAPFLKPERVQEVQALWSQAFFFDKLRRLQVP